MGNIFRPNSPLMRLMTLITNLFCLNILWILSCLPVVTAGAATTAMYYVLFQYITKQDDSVLKPFFKSFKENFAGVTPIWIMHLLIGGALGAEIFYLAQGTQRWLQVIFGALLFIYVGVSSYLYPIMARYDTSRKKALLNSFALSTRHLFSTVCVVILNTLPVVLIVFAPELFWKTILLWTLGGFSILAYLNSKIILRVLQQYEPQPSAQDK